jgi:phosphate transport system substrate-binding protein
MPDDFRVSITNPAGKDAYPIASFTWLLIPQQSKDAAKGTVLRNFVEWMATNGQSMTTQLSYAPLPKSVVDKVLATAKAIK